MTTTTNLSVPLQRVANGFDTTTIRVYVETDGTAGTMKTIAPKQSIGEQQMADTIYIPILDDVSASTNTALVFQSVGVSLPDTRVFAYEGVIWFTLASNPDQVHQLPWLENAPSPFGWLEADNYCLGSTENAVVGGGWVIGVLDDGLSGGR